MSDTEAYQLIPQTMDQAIALKEHARKAIAKSEEAAKLNRDLKKMWKKKYEAAMKRISKIAVHEANSRRKARDA